MPLPRKKITAKKRKYTRKKAAAKKKPAPKKKALAPAEDSSPPSPPAASAGGKAPVKRNPDGTFLPGNKEGGRKEGSRNKIVIAREALEAGLREYLNSPVQRNKVHKAIDRLLDMAMHADDDKVAVQAIKVLTDKVLAQAKQSEDHSANAETKINIVIDNHTDPKDVTPPRVIIDQKD